MIELDLSSASRRLSATLERVNPLGMMMSWPSTKLLAIALTLGLGAAVVLTACEPGDKPGPEYMPDMARGPAYKAFAPNQAMRNGITLQRPVAGTIKRGARPFHYGKGDAEATRAGLELTNPYRPTEPTLAKGKVLYQTYCQVCHGEQGKGDGPISSKIPPPPSYRSERLLAYPPGRIFHVVTMGANKMPSYAVQLTPDERWLVITYVRSQLQGLPEAAPGVGEGASLPPEPEPATATATATAAATTAAVPASTPASAPTPAPAARAAAESVPTAHGALPAPSVPAAGAASVPGASASSSTASAAGSAAKPVSSPAAAPGSPSIPDAAPASVPTDKPAPAHPTAPVPAAAPAAGPGGQP